MSRILATCMYLSLSASVDVFRRHSSQGTKAVSLHWPPGRPSEIDTAIRSPCGSSTHASNRTELPLRHGYIAFVAQELSPYIEVFMSHMDDPTSNSDFEKVIDSSHLSASDSQLCLQLPDPPIHVQAGDNATIQVRHEIKNTVDEASTAYSCADVVYVPEDMFKNTSPCSNTTANHTSPTSTTTGLPFTDWAGLSNLATASGAPMQTEDDRSYFRANTIIGLTFGLIGLTVLVVAVSVCSCRLLKRRQRVPEPNMSVANVARQNQYPTRSEACIALQKM